MAKKGLQPLRMKPLTGSFDSRSMPELVAQETWRMLQNTRTTARGRICRMPGWEKFLAGIATHRAYNNEDLNDQLLALQIYYDDLSGIDSSGVTIFPPNNPSFGDFCGTTKRTRTQGRQPITFGAELTSSLGTRHCLAGTQSRLYVLNQGKGNWNILADGLGGTASNPEIRLQHAGLGDYAFFTNNFDEPFYWRINQGPTGCSMQSVQTIPELQEIGVTKVRCMASYKGTLFLANVEQDGERRTNRIIWSRYQSPLEVVEDPGVSTAGTQDLDFGEDIIAIKELGDFLYFYTDRAIWLCVVTGGIATFAFVRKYTAKKGDGTLVYAYTLTGSKDSHYYMSTDGIYEWNPYVQAPIRQEWIHQASNILYDNLNKSACVAHTAGYDQATKELWFSCAQGTSKIPSITLTCNTDYGQCSKVDHGFTTLFSYTPDTRESVRDWLLNNCVVNEACLDSPEVQAMGFATPKEGPGVPITTPPCTSFVQHVYTDVELTTKYPSQPQLDYTALENFDVDGPHQLDLIGQGQCGDQDFGVPLQDLLTGNGLYLRPIVTYNLDQGLALSSKTTFPFDPAFKYRLSVRVAGNNVEFSSHVTLNAEVNNNDVDQEIVRAWNDGFSTEEIVFTGLEPGKIGLFFINTDLEGGNYGPLVDEIKLERLDPDTLEVLEVMFQDDFDQENLSATACYLEDGISVEDYTQDEPSADSLCARLGDQSIAEGCNNCEGAALFVGASASDWCLKQLGTIYARERRTATGYALDGYDTIFLKGPMTFGSNTMKMLANDESGGGAVQLEYEAEPQTIPSKMKLRVGASRRCEDPLKICGIKWYEEAERPVQCVDDDRGMEWAAFAVDIALYLEFKISGTGGASCYSSLTVNVGPGGC